MNDELKVLTRKQLFTLDEVLNSLPKQADKKVQAELYSKKRRVKTLLYDCRFCKDAKQKLKFDKEFNVMDELFHRTCNEKICPYKEHFINESKQETKEFVNLKEFEKSFLKSFLR